MKFTLQLINLFFYDILNKAVPKFHGLLSGKIIKLEHFLSTVQILEFAYVRVDIFPLPNAFSYVKGYIHISILTTDEKWM